LAHDRRIEEYLEEARKAEEMALHAPDETTKQGWIKIAEEYRAMARLKRGF